MVAIQGDVLSSRLIMLFISPLLSTTMCSSRPGTPCGSSGRNCCALRRFYPLIASLLDGNSCGTKSADVREECDGGLGPAPTKRRGIFMQSMRTGDACVETWRRSWLAPAANKFRTSAAERTPMAFVQTGNPRSTSLEAVALDETTDPL
jgi:hypothetical protein